MNRQEKLTWSVLAVGLALMLPSPAAATHPCTSPLILDLEEDGLLIWGSNFGVDFDIDGDGTKERIGWTGIGRDAFLWTDRNRNGVVDDGSELFGTATEFPGDGFAKNGFEALARLDTAAYGGNGDGILDAADDGWRSLLLWIDENRNGVSERAEIRPLAAEGIQAFDLAYDVLDEFDGAGNLWAFEGTFVQQIREQSDQRFRLGRIVDVFFDYDDAANP